jgi:DNA-3-methyladenine glycosylase
MHSLFNVVTDVLDVPHAVLIRGIIPSEGIETMLLRAGKTPKTKNPGIGPGNVSRLLGIHYSHTGLDLTRKAARNSPFGIWIEDRGAEIDPVSIISGPRIGVDYAGADALLPYRFRIQC